MEHLDGIGLLDPDGKPFAPHISHALTHMLPRFRRRFPTIRDEAVQLHIFERAGYLVTRAERKKGPLENLHGYVWVTLENVTKSYLRNGAGRLDHLTVEPEVSRLVVAQIPSRIATPDDIERDVLRREVFDSLTPRERVVFVLKLAGKSSREIAELRGGTPGSVDVLYHRAVRRLQKKLGGDRPNASDESGSVERERRVTPQTSLQTTQKTTNDETPPTRRPAHAAGTG